MNTVITDDQAQIDKPDELHYYCSGRTFLSLLQHKKLWLTDLSLSNDSMEGQWAVDRYLCKFKRTPEDQLRKRGAKLALEFAFLGKEALGMCFSSKGDLLSQWRGYADNGTGLCVSFDRKALEGLAEAEARAKSLDCFGLYPVCYDSIETMNLPAEIYSAFEDRIESYSENSIESGSLSWSQNAFSILEETRVVSKMFQVKNPAFSEEKEWRLLLVDKAGSIPGASYRESGGVISPKLEIDLHISKITGVRLGPRSPNNTGDITGVLRHHGSKVHASRSRASYVVR